MADIDVLPAETPHRSALAARQFVQRLGSTQVLLTDVRASGPDEFRAVARWPRPQMTRPQAAQDAEAAADADAAARQEPLLVAETLRQLGVYLPQRFYGVTAESRLLVEELRFSLEPIGPEVADSACDGRIRTRSEVGCVIRAVRRNAAGAAKGHMRSLDLEVRLSFEGREFARADVVARVLCPAAYRAVRARGHGVAASVADGEIDSGSATGTATDTPAPRGGTARSEALTAVDPARVGVSRRRDVLVAVDGRGAVRIAPADPYHPFLHEHPSDHITGMTLIGALQQAAALQANEPRLRLRSCTLRALRFTEPAPPPAVEIGPAGRFEIRQRGAVTATGEAHFEA